MSARPLRVWLVDDDASIRWVLERALKSAGMLPRVFESAEPALDALRGDSPDVLVPDIRMPGLSGLELVRTLCEATVPTCSSPTSACPGFRASSSSARSTVHGRNYRSL